MGTHLKSKLTIALAVLLLCTATAFAALQLPRHTEAFYVNDFANVLSDETERYIMETSRAYDRSDGTQVVVATIPTLAGASIEEYALELARSWGVGGAEADNGLLVLLAVEDREIRVEIGYGLEGIFNDAKTGRFIRNDATPYLSQNQWDQGILALYNALLGELQNPTPLPQEEEGGGSFAVALLIVLALLVIFGRAGGPPGIWMHRPRFPGGGFGGGMGGFGGGGGGGFSGGGGGFGGGGASGKF